MYSNFKRKYNQKKCKANCCSVTQSCLTLGNPMDCSTPGFPVLHCFLEFAQTHVHWVGDATNHLILCCPLLLLPSIFLASESFTMGWLFASSGQIIGASASASVLPMNIQGWFPLGLTGLISLWSKGLSRVSSTVQNHQFFGTQSVSDIHIWLLETP